MGSKSNYTRDESLSATQPWAQTQAQKAQEGKSTFHRDRQSYSSNLLRLRLIGGIFANIQRKYDRACQKIIGASNKICPMVRPGSFKTHYPKVFFYRRCVQPSSKVHILQYLSSSINSSKLSSNPSIILESIWQDNTSLSSVM